MSLVKILFSFVLGYNIVIHTKCQILRETLSFWFPKGPDIKCFVIFLDFHFNSNKRITGANQNSRLGTYDNIHITYIRYTYTLFNLEFKVGKDKLVSSSYKNDFKTTKTRNYNLLKFKILKRVIL